VTFEIDFVNFQEVLQLPIIVSILPHQPGTVELVSVLLLTRFGT
jgi:hypothetical protein